MPNRILVARGWLWVVGRAQTVRRHALFLGNFSLAKLAIYFTPLLIAKTTPAETYGGIEFAWSAGLLVASLAIGAALSGATQRYLIGRQTDVIDELAALTAVMSATSAALFLLATLVPFSPQVLVAIAAFGLMVLHNSLATVLRMRRLRNAIAWADGASSLGAALIVGLAFLTTGQARLTTVTWGFFALSLAVTVIATAIWMVQRRPALCHRIGHSIAIGLPMTIGGLMAMWLGVGGRLTVGLIAPHDVAAYALAFRISGLALGIHQLAATAQFARLYVARTREADRLLSNYLVMVAVLSTSIAVVGAPIIPRLHFDAVDPAAMVIVVRVLPILCLHVFFWIAFAMLQLRVNRSGLAKKAIRPLLYVSVCGIALIFGANALVPLGIVWLSWAITAHAGLYFAVMAWVLARARLPHRRVALVTALTCATIVGVWGVEHIFLRF